ncbi:MAG: hypothetical protein JSU70_12095 [Phycisphaerales bacterium]|nr:MAG: hypothetical protein JSU70_12095 [Phycisphaerales bacterium]
MRPPKPSTPSDYTALFWAACLIVVGFGAVCLVFGYRAPPEKAQEAAKLIHVGYGLIAGVAVALAIRRLISDL